MNQQLRITSGGAPPAALVEVEHVRDALFLQLAYTAQRSVMTLKSLSP